jgi:hypothetical protein
MTDPIEINRHNWDERSIIHARDSTGFYGLDRLRSNEDNLHSIEAAELGDISQKKVLHLQCHIGTDTLRLVRLGAIASGLDFSLPKQFVRRDGSPARRGSKPISSKAEWMKRPVWPLGLSISSIPPGEPFAGCRIWGFWAHVIATVLAPGGELYFADAHPSFLLMEERDGKLEPTHDFQTPADRPLEFKSKTTYTGDPTVLTYQSTREWIHPLSAIVGALIDAGLTIKMFREHEVLPWQGLRIMVPSSDRLWRLPDGHPRFPLSLSLRARKE